MKIEQLSEVIQHTSNVPMGYFFKTNQQGFGLVEETKKIAHNIWKQTLIVIHCDQIDFVDIEDLLKSYTPSIKTMPLTFYFANIDKISKKLRDYIIHNFSICRDENIHKNSHVIYHISQDENHNYQDKWDDYVICHSVHYTFER